MSWCGRAIRPPWSRRSRLYICNQKKRAVYGEATHCRQAAGDALVKPGNLLLERRCIMKIAVIGATGFVGSAILQEALQRGHEVTAIVRHPEKVKPHPKLRPHKADVQKGDEVTRSVAGHDAVISAFNPGWTNPNMYDLQVRGTR